MRTLAILAAGAMLGALLTLATIELRGGWYVYKTVPSDECRVMPPSGEVVPHQPNPCHVRYPRWHLLY